jgi:hypothetical protein
LTSSNYGAGAKALGTASGRVSGDARPAKALPEACAARHATTVNIQVAAATLNTQVAAATLNTQVALRP